MVDEPDGAATLDATPRANCLQTSVPSSVRSAPEKLLVVSYGTALFERTGSSAVAYRSACADDARQNAALEHRIRKETSACMTQYMSLIVLGRYNLSKRMPAPGRQCLRLVENPRPDAPHNGPVHKLFECSAFPFESLRSLLSV